MLINRENLPYY